MNEIYESFSGYLTEDSKKFLVAFSGGLDSTVLLYALKQALVKEKLNKEIGKSSSILFESHKMSYSDGYFKVKTKESKNSIKPGSIANVKIVSRQGDSLIAELK